MAMQAGPLRLARRLAVNRHVKQCFCLTSTCNLKAVREHLIDRRQDLCGLPVPPGSEPCEAQRAFQHPEQRAGLTFRPRDISWWL